MLNTIIAVHKLLNLRAAYIFNVQIRYLNEPNNRISVPR